jgi:hypothetical protein
VWYVTQHTRVAVDSECLYVIMESQKAKDHWEDQYVGGWTILKWILERWGGRDWIKLAHDRDQWRVLVNTVMTLRGP